MTTVDEVIDLYFILGLLSMFSAMIAPGSSPRDLATNTASRILSGIPA